MRPRGMTQSFVVIAVLLMSPGWAYAVCCAAITVLSATNVQITSTPVTSALQQQTQDLNQQTQELKRALLTGMDTMQKGIVSSNKTFQDDYLRKLRQLLVEVDQARARTRMEEAMGPLGQMSSDCGGPITAASIANTTKARKETVQKVRQAITEHGRAWGSRRSQIEKLAESDPNSIALNGDAIAPPDGTLSDKDLQEAQEYIMRVTDPFPPLNLPASAKEGTLAQRRLSERYEALRKQQQAEMAAPTQMMSTILANNYASIPVAEDDELYRLLTKIYPEQEPETYVKDGKMSLNAVLDLEARGRHENKDWHTEIQGKNEKALLLEVARMQALQVRLLSEMYKVQRLDAQIRAMEMARSVRNEYSAPLGDLYQKAQPGAID